MRRLALLAFILIVFAPNPTHAATTTAWEFDRSKEKNPIGSEIGNNKNNDTRDRENFYKYRNGRLYPENKHKKLTDTTDQRIWDTFKGIAGTEFTDTYLAGLATVKSKRSGGTLAQVIPFEKIPDPSWVLAVNIDDADYKNPKWVRDMSIILTHEYAHILTLNKTQVDHKFTARYCKRAERAYIIVGCARDTSYVQAFSQTFWNQKEVDEVKKIGAKRYYKKHKDEFTTEYAATNPAEDIAESFTDFVLLQKPDGDTKKEQKVLFFYQYPELVTIRDDIRASIAVQLGK